MYSCGPSENEIKIQYQKEIRSSKDAIANQFESIMDEYYSSNEDLNKLPAVINIEAYLNSGYEEVDTYAKKHLDSVPKLEAKLRSIIYGDLIEYANQQDWNKIDKSQYIKLEKKLLVKGDEFSNSEVFRDPSSPKYINQNGFFMFYKKFNKDEKKPLIGLKTQYYADDWLFIKKASISIDGDVYSLNFDNWDKDNSDGMIYEWSTLSSPSFNILVKIIKSKKSKIRYTGDRYHDDRTVSSSQKRALKSVLKVYYGLYLKDQF